MPPPPPSPHALLHALAFATVSARPLSRTCFPAPRALCQVKTTQIVTQPNRRLAQPSFGVPAWKATMGTPSAVVEELQLHASDGATVAAFLVRSQPHRPSRTAVVLMTDILGYENHETRAVAMLLAAHGFTTIVPDLFRGNPWVQGRDKSEYESWRRTHDPATVRGDILLARQALTERSLGTSLGLVGFCFGGGRLMEEVALNTSGLNPDAAVAFYPTRFDPEDVGRNAHCPLLVQTGDRDDLVPVHVVNTLRETLQANASVKEWNVEVYEGFGHAFAHHPSSEADKAQSEVAFARALAWLKRHL